MAGAATPGETSLPGRVFVPGQSIYLASGTELAPFEELVAQSIQPSDAARLTNDWQRRDTLLELVRPEELARSRVGIVLLTATVQPYEAWRVARAEGRFRRQNVGTTDRLHPLTEELESAFVSDYVGMHVMAETVDLNNHPTARIETNVWYFPVQPRKPQLNPEARRESATVGRNVARSIGRRLTKEQRTTLQPLKIPEGAIGLLALQATLQAELEADKHTS